MRKLSLAALIAAFVIGVSPVMVGGTTPAVAADMPAPYEDKPRVDKHHHDHCILLWPFHLLGHVFHAK